MADDCDFDELDAPAIAHLLHHLHRIERQMTEFANDQAHLDADVASIGTQFQVAVNELKAAVSAGHALDFTNLDNLVSQVTAEAGADAPPAPTPTPAPEPTPAPVDAPPVSDPVPADPSQPSA